MVLRYVISMASRLSEFLFGAAKTLPLAFLLTALFSALPFQNTAYGAQSAADAASQKRLLRQTRRKAAFLKLRRIAASKGLVPVIVKLESPDEPDANLKPRSARTVNGPARSKQRGRFRADGGEQRSRRKGAINRLQIRVSQGLARPDRLLETFKNVPFMVVAVDAADLNALEAMPEVVSVHLDERTKSNLGQSVLDINADDLADTQSYPPGFTGQGFAVAILDTGVQAAHPAFGTPSRIIGAAEACFSTSELVVSPTFSIFENSSSVCPGSTFPPGLERMYGTGTGTGAPCASSVSGCDHGTHVAGIAASEDVGTGRRGVAPGAGIVAVQIGSSFDDLSFCGSSNPCVAAWTHDIVGALDYLYQDVPAILAPSHVLASANISFGGGAPRPCAAACGTTSATRRPSTICCPLTLRP